MRPCRSVALEWGSVVAQAFWLEEKRVEGGRLVIEAGGAWDITHAGALETRLKAARPPDARHVTFDIAGVERLDTAGAWLLHRTVKEYGAAGIIAEFAGIRPEHRVMLEQVAANDRPRDSGPPRPNALLQILARTGVATLEALEEGRQVVGFLGQVMTTLLGTLVRPHRLRLTSLVHHMEQVGLDALPIVGLLSFLIGVVLAFQGAVVLQRFGAEIFVVDLIAISVLREIGILMTAIVVAGRSGSAFAAAIGSMMVREEVDAMRTLGLDPMEVLVLPRLLALAIALPLLAFFADMMGLLGGGIMTWAVLDIAPTVYLERLGDAVGIWSFWTGMIKAPVFGVIIAIVGCLEGFRVSGSAESVGRQTTRAVVTSLFLVIVVDALFSIFFSTVGV